MGNRKGLRAICAVNSLGFIGLNGGLPWRSSSDFRHFKALTQGTEGYVPKLLVGWNTYQTLPPLKGREIYIHYGREGEPSHLLNAQTHEAGGVTYNDMDWCIGGKNTYERYQRVFTQLHISHIRDNSLGDMMFPDLRYLSRDCEIFNYYFDINEVIKL